MMTAQFRNCNFNNNLEIHTRGLISVGAEGAAASTDFEKIDFARTDFEKGCSYNFYFL